MVIDVCEQVDGTELLTHAWHRVRLYKNIDFTTQRLIATHKPGPKQTNNVRKQAAEVRFCLIQAEEYFAAAETASLATKPLMLYYALMSLALAEVLMKKDGNHRLQRLREEHSAHGLSLSISGPIDKAQPTKSILANLRAAVQCRHSGSAYGTFAVWRSVTRESPVIAEVNDVHDEGARTGRPKVMFVGNDAAPKDAPSYSLLDALCALPHLSPPLAGVGIRPPVVRADISAEVTVATGDGRMTMIVHPAPVSTLDAFYERIVMSPAAVSEGSFQELPSGMIISMPIRKWRLPVHIGLPPAICLSLRRTCFITNDWDLGEFGALYVAMHILGNVARYYPDAWMPHAEASSEFAQLADRLCSFVCGRAPILFASQLDRRLYIAAT